LVTFGFVFANEVALSSGGFEEEGTEGTVDFLLKELVLLDRLEPEPKNLRPTDPSGN